MAELLLWPEDVHQGPGWVTNLHIVTDESWRVFYNVQLNDAVLGRLLSTPSAMAMQMPIPIVGSQAGYSFGVRRVEQGVSLFDRGDALGWVELSIFRAQLYKLALLYIERNPRSFFANRRAEWESQQQQLVSWTPDLRTQLLYAHLDQLSIDVDKGARDPLDLVGLLGDPSYPVEAAVLLMLRRLRSVATKRKILDGLEMLTSQERAQSRLVEDALELLRSKEA